MDLERLSISVMRVDASKSKLFAAQNEYLGYWITRQGIRPVYDIMEAILYFKAPVSRKEEPTTPFYWNSQPLLKYVIFAGVSS
jgi:hypothetical protein